MDNIWTYYMITWSQIRVVEEVLRVFRAGKSAGRKILSSIAWAGTLNWKLAPGTVLPPRQDEVVGASDRIKLACNSNIVDSSLYHYLA